MWVDLPPSSITVFFTVGAAAARILRPTAVEPVKVTMSTRGSEVRTAATSLSLDTTTWKMPGGMSVSSAAMRPSSSPAHGVSWAGLSITAFPASNAGTLSATLRYSGAFHGVMAATTPTGMYCSFCRNVRPRPEWVPASRRNAKLRA